ncbi:hypothetical protein EDC01DRAFT_761493 [Geopyxis carbonaria]|nr:hypothetical protein EDC01DRAFT_761493 [Geopyxis carbonaria]
MANPGTPENSKNGKSRYMSSFRHRMKDLGNKIRHPGDHSNSVGELFKNPLSSAEVTLRNLKQPFIRSHCHKCRKSYRRSDMIEVGFETWECDGCMRKGTPKTTSPCTKCGIMVEGAVSCETCLMADAAAASVGMKPLQRREDYATIKDGMPPPPVPAQSLAGMKHRRSDSNTTGMTAPPTQRRRFFGKVNPFGKRNKQDTDAGSFNGTRSNQGSEAQLSGNLDVDAMDIEKETGSTTSFKSCLSAQAPVLPQIQTYGRLDATAITGSMRSREQNVADQYVRREIEKTENIYQKLKDVQTQDENDRRQNRGESKIDTKITETNSGAPVAGPKISTPINPEEDGIKNIKVNVTSESSMMNRAPGMRHGSSTWFGSVRDI